MRYQPKNHTHNDLLKKCGFISANRGWVLPRKKMAGKPVQLHALTYPENFIEFHADYDVDGRHVSEKRQGRHEMFIAVLSAVDEGRTPEISDKMKRNYPRLVEALSL